MTDEAYDIGQYDYDLPAELIAQKPAARRDESRLLALPRAGGRIEHAVFRQIGRFLRPGDLLVLNNTRVFPARTYGTRASGGRVEIFFLQPLEKGQWEAMVHCHGKPKSGEYVELEEGRLTVKLGRQLEGGRWLVVVPAGTDLIAALEQIGRMPLPPYIRRDKSAPLPPEDRERYQTVYASQVGAVAAPTAGLHFTPALLSDLIRQGVSTAEVTLHVGPGTFQPVKTQDIRSHRMHAETYEIGESVCEAIRVTREARGRVIAVGTTSCRVLESVAKRPEGLSPHRASTEIFMYPPYTFRLTDGLVTNFHLPRSTLLMLVSAFAGRERILAAYEEAKKMRYRFYSYGDAMLIA